jgi:hypothetical protein
MTDDDNYRGPRDASSFSFDYPEAAEASIAKGIAGAVAKLAGGSVMADVVEPRAEIVQFSPARNRTNAAWLRAQLEDLAGHLATDARAWSADQQHRAMLAIARGTSWRIEVCL